MILFSKEDRVFRLQTIASSYWMRVLPSGHLGHILYGKRISEDAPWQPLEYVYPTEVGSQIAYSEANREFSLNMALLECSTYGKGDFRDPMVHVRFADNSRLADFHYVSHDILPQKPSFPSMPETFDTQNNASTTLKIILWDEVRQLFADLYYTVFPEIDCITRRLVLRNASSETMVIEKAMSFNLDFPDHEYDLFSFDGAWIRERHVTTRSLTYGITKIDSKRGVSSADHNPLLVLKRPHTDEEVGECYGFSLLYSGNFEATAEVTPHGLTRFLMGINSFDFAWTLAPGTEFVTPEAVMTFSQEGLSKQSRNFHALINQHIVASEWQNRERPILINNWEATYFDFTEAKLLKLAKTAKKMGMELFVLDDGWFGKRNDDTSSLGDWQVNLKKMPSGIAGFAAKINQIGLDFGIWVEPEMVNPDSDLYRTHPDWAISHPQYQASCGRHQLILDFTNPLVRDYTIHWLSDLFDHANIAYCKWDMNRGFSDIYSQSLAKEEQRGFFHRYMLGLYEVLGTIKRKYPHILMESCSSGGSRFDMGMLYYMPQTWTSDDTDGIERLFIQYGTSFGYPLSTMGAHVSNTPNMQVLRQTPIETRFNTAMFGLLGYELDLNRLSAFDKKVIQKQIVFYKEHRKLLQFGSFRRFYSPFTSNRCEWMVVDPQGQEAILGTYQLMAKPNGEWERLKISGLQEVGTYRITNRPQYHHLRVFGDLIKHALPIRLKAHGTLFNLLANHYLLPAETDDFIMDGTSMASQGILPKQKFIGSGYNAAVRLMGDFGSRVYHVKRIGELTQ